MFFRQTATSAYAEGGQTVRSIRDINDTIDRKDVGQHDSNDDHGVAGDDGNDDEQDTTTTAMIQRRQRRFVEMLMTDTSSWSFIQVREVTTAEIISFSFLAVYLPFYPPVLLYFFAIFP